MSDGQQVGSVYYYAPNKAANIFFTVGFAIAGLFHVVQCIRNKCFKLMGFHTFCGLLFTVGFSLRDYGAFHYDNVNVFIASTILIYMAPPLLELANYHVLGRILYFVPYNSPVHPGRVWTTFGMLSTVVEVFNALGVAWLAQRGAKPEIIKLGDIFMKIGLLLQLVVIALFILLAIVFQTRCIRGGVHIKNVWAPLITLYVSTSLILIRTIYRIVEYFLSSQVEAASDPTAISVISRYEWYFFVFEATVLLLNEIIWNVFHPRRHLPQSFKVYLAQDGRTQIEGPGWTDKRSMFVTIMDPFGWMSGSQKEQERPFWETDGYGGNKARASHESQTV